MPKTQTISTKRKSRKSKKDLAPEIAEQFPSEAAVPSEVVVVKSVTSAPVVETPFSLQASIIDFNGMYGVENNDTPTNLKATRVEKFHNILKEELTEYNVIMTKLHAANRFSKAGLTAQAEAAELQAFTDLSDWLCDIQVYCASEMRRWGLENDPTLKIIMESNASKLGEDGLPIIDPRGKIMKGPNYWKPEPKIMEALRTKIAATRIALES